MSTMTPREMVRELDKYIVSQSEAKRAVAVSLRNRWRRLQLEESLRQEVVPKNILMIGPTGVGKTEIARRIARLSGAPFIKVEATKFTEVGYVGRDVESIMRDLVEAAIKDERAEHIRRNQHLAEEAAEDRMLDQLCADGRDRQETRVALRKGELDDEEFEFDTEMQVGVEVMAPPGMESMIGQLQDMFKNVGGKTRRRRKMKIERAFKALTQEEAHKMLDDEEIKATALKKVEQQGIVFIDEIDKISRRNERGGAGEVSREGVQRDLLPLIEGCTVGTKYGMVQTDHVLFIASGAFHHVRPSDLIPELQGRLPVRVELQPLGAAEFVRILIEPRSSLVRQYSELLKVEGVELDFQDDGVKQIAEIAYRVNEKTENIGARRLHTLMETLLEELSFGASDSTGKRVVIDGKYVDKHLGKYADDEDLSRYIL